MDAGHCSIAAGADFLAVVSAVWSAPAGPAAAVRAFEALSGTDAQRFGLMMPIHWGLFDLALHAWRQPMERLLELAEEKKIKVWAPEPGRPTEVVAGVELRSDWWR